MMPAVERLSDEIGVSRWMDLSEQLSTDDFDCIQS